MSRRLWLGLVVGPSLLALGGCANLAIRVDILNAAYWSSPQYVESVTVAKIADMEQSIRDGRYISQREAMKYEIRRTLVEMSRTTPPVVALSTVDALMEQFGRTIDGRFEAARRYFRTAFEKVAAANRAAGASDREALMREARTAFGDGAEALAVLVSQLSQDIRSALTPPGGAPTLAAQTITRRVETIALGLIGDAGILDDPHAAAVIYAPGDYWTGQFNQTLCFGSFGNTDCAVKMEDLGSFTLKGVRLDATKIPQPTFSVAREAIQTVAAVYGIPVPKGPPASSAAAGESAPAAADIDSPVRRQRDAGTALAQLRLARLAMFETITQQRQAIRGTDAAARTQAVKTIKSVIEANRKLLDPSPAP